MENASTSPASQSHIQKRPSCQRADSPILIPVAKISVMDGQTPTGDVAHRVRPARAADLTQIAAIENAGGPQFEEYFGDAIEPILLSPATDGRQRASEPGFLLVAGDSVGFVHVLVIDGHAHLEQLSVRPTPATGDRRGPVPRRDARGTRPGLRPAQPVHLSRRAVERSVLPGLGFTEVTDLAPFERGCGTRSASSGLDVNGVRVVMEVALR